MNKIIEEQEPVAAKIIKLDESVVNRIAAGEIIQNPSNCVKELIENSIDAKAKQIQVTTKYGGLKSIQIADNGTGILKENLEILCERFTTSKLQKYEDLQQMSTYGFRGEALASISMISRLTVQTKTRNEMVAYRAKYDCGVLVESPVAVAGNQGTTITIEDLFYNVPVRTKTMILANEQFTKIYGVISKYAIHNHRISFSLKRHGEANSFKSQPSNTPIEAIRLTFGNNVANSLLPVSLDSSVLKFKMSGYVSKGDFDAMKKAQLILFINHRLVESKALKKALFDEVYRKVLTKAAQPFVYMAIEVAPENVDINVSPTKHEVNLLNEELIVEAIREAIEERLLQTNETRVMYTQQLLPGAPKVVFETSKLEKEKIYAKDMIRADPTLQSIDKFLRPTNSEEQNSENASTSQIISFSPVRVKRIQERTKLTSVRELLAEVEKNCDKNLTEQIRKLKFVGNASQEKSLIQCENLLYLVDNRKLAWQTIYQLTLHKFSNFDAIEFEEPLKVRELVEIAAKVLEKSVDGAHVEDVLVSNSEMLREYFRISINDDGHLVSLPMLLPEYAPLMAHLPEFIIRLAQVTYDDEKDCFQCIAKELARFYSQWSLTSSEKEYSYLMEHIIFPKIRSTLLPPESFLTDSTFIKLTSLQDLFKVFERC